MLDWPNVARPIDHLMMLEAFLLQAVFLLVLQVCRLQLLVYVPKFNLMNLIGMVGFYCIGNSSMRTASKGEGSASWSSVGFTPRKITSEDDNVFSFREARVQEYLSSLSEAESSSRDSFQKTEEKDESFSIKNGWVYFTIALMRFILRTHVFFFNSFSGQSYL